MTSQDLIQERIAQLLRRSRAEATLVSLFNSKRSVTKFTTRRILQSLEEDDIDVYVKVALNGHIGVAVTNSLESSQLALALKHAMEIARVSRKTSTSNFISRPQPIPACASHFQSTLRFGPTDRLALIETLTAEARRRKVDLTGTLVVGEEEMAVANSAGLFEYRPFTTAGIKLVATKEKGSGFVSGLSRDIHRIDAPELLDQAIRTCLLNQKHEEIRLGRYDCLLEPEAVAEILDWLGYLGFGAKPLHERTSFLSGRIGEKICGSNITIVDDGLSEENLCLPFDFEGTPRQRVTLIENGVARGVVYDHHYGHLYHTRSTGHALAPDESEGPFPMHLTLAAGHQSLESMRRSLSRGILVTRFHYVNGFLNPQEALMTGLTRDGTFWVEKGKIKKALKNLRFTESILSALRRVEMISRERKLIGDPSQEMGAALVPAILIRNFAFTGRSS